VRAGKIAKLVLVDAWEPGLYYTPTTQVEMDALHAAVKLESEFFGGKVEVVRSRSVEASREFADRSLDFVYIDGAHDYKNVIADLRAWWPKVGDRGVFAGHDCDIEGVRKALAEFCSEIGIQYVKVQSPSDPSWYIAKTALTASSISTLRQDYLEVVELALRHQVVFKNFRRVKEYQHVIEHTEEVMRHDEELLAKRGINENLLRELSGIDNIGGPVIHESTLFPNMYYSTKVPRTALITLEVLDFVSGGFPGMKVVEVGAGFGAQMKMLMDVVSLISYTTVDLASVNRLVEKCFSDFIRQGWQAKGSSHRSIDYENLDTPSENYDLFLSCYGLSECKRTVAERYVELFCRRSRVGYVRFNEQDNPLVDTLPLGDFVRAVGGQVSDTGLPGEKTKLVTWGKR
jgi:hypothetical protein